MEGRHGCWRRPGTGAQGRRGAAAAGGGQEAPGELKGRSEALSGWGAFSVRARRAGQSQLSSGGQSVSILTPHPRLFSIEEAT